jgi:endonuclease III
MHAEERAAAVLERLRKRYPDPATALIWRSPWELLVATILAAQCTDERVNRVTPELFRKWPDIEDMVGAPLNAVEQVARSTGFFRSKARSLVGAAREIAVWG